MARIAIDARKLADYGIGTYLRSLLEDLARIGSGDEFVVFLPERGRLPVEAPHLVPVPTAARNYGVSEHLVLPWLARRHRVGLYHAPHYVLPALAPRPAVVTIHDAIHLLFPEHLPGAAARLYARRVMARSFRRAARVLTVSECSKRDLLRLFGGPAERVVVIANRVDERFFAPIGGDVLARTRERWRLPERFILYAGNVKPHKNLDRLVRAFAEIRRRGKAGDVRLVLLGNDLARYRSLRLLAAELGVAELVRPLGYLPGGELAAIYRLAAVFAYPSLYEGFGLPPLEAMASGVPVVAANASSLPEVAGDAAWLVDPTSVGEIASGIESLLVDPAAAEALAARGRARAERFRGDAPTRRLLAVYHEVMEAGS